MRNNKRSSGREQLCRMVAGVTLLFMVFGMFSSCRKEDEEPTELTAMDYSTIEDYSVYVSLAGYTDLEISLSSETDPKGERVWKTVLDRAEILRYPEQQVNYYVEQTLATYRYYAEQNGWSLEETMERLGVSEESIHAQAKEMVKGDLVYRYIVADVGITLTQEEKVSLFDRYARQYAESYGYDVKYVTERLSDLVYDSMLYDKTMEYLILHNRFVVSSEGGTNG